MKNINDIAKIHKDKEEKVHYEPFHFLKWIFKAEFIILIIFFIVGNIFNFIPDKIKFIIKYNIEKSLNNDIKNGDYCYEDIIQALKDNTSIKNEEKEFIDSILKKEIEENLNYIDMSLVAKRLKKLQVTYHKKYNYNEQNKQFEVKNPNITSMNIAGKYIALFHKIDIYEQIDNNQTSINYKDRIFDFEASNKKIYFHELNHLITRNSFSTFMDTFAKDLELNNENTLKIGPWKAVSNSIQIIHKNVFLETINELFTREYFDEYLQKDENIRVYNAYEDEMIYVYALAEIVSEDVIRKYKFCDNESILIDGLLEIDDNIDEIYSLITSINSVSLYENKSEDLQKENYKRIHNGYAYFYEKKYNKKMSDDLIMLLYFYGTPIQTDEERNFIREFLEMESYDKIIQVIPKGYVSEEYKKNHKGVQVEYTKKGNKEFIEVNNM